MSADGLVTKKSKVYESDDENYYFDEKVNNQSFDDDYDEYLESDLKIKPKNNSVKFFNDSEDELIEHPIFPEYNKNNNEIFEYEENDINDSSLYLDDIKLSIPIEPFNLEREKEEG